MGELQCAHTLHYCIRETTDGWLLTLRKEAQEGSESETVRLLTSAEAVKALQIYLYENAVSLEVWQDVLADILPPEKIRPVENHETATEKKS